MSARQAKPPAPAKSQSLLTALEGNSVNPPPVWLMRQAGRYLPEYREVRARARSFLDLCYSPVDAAEVTLQPIRRFGFDAAILFSDILVVPHALGQRLAFVEGEGPKLDPIRTAADLTRLDPGAVLDKLAPVFETVRRVRQDLPRETALIGFCGAPWTVATYMAEGGGSADQAAARTWAYRDPQGFATLIAMLVEASAAYLVRQIEAGADVVQIFDTWAGALPEDEFETWAIAPTARIVHEVKARHPHIPVIGFPRGAGERAQRYARETGVDGLGCDTSQPLDVMKRIAGDGTCAVQGNLDPLLLAAGGPALEARTTAIVDAMRGLPFVFNLGHGIVPETPPENVARLVACVRRSGA